jgi:type VI protein secretion system component VasK
VLHRGSRELERSVAEHFRSVTLPMVSALFGRFPFNQAAEREVAPAELDILAEPDGAFWKDVRTFYAPVLSLQAGVYRARSGGREALALPKDLLPTLNQLSKLAHTLFDEAGKRQPLRFTVRGLPGSQISDGKSIQPTIAFLRVGPASIYGFNQRASAASVSVEWWNQGVAMVGIESTAARSGRRHTESLEVADSAWSLYRLLQKTTLDNDGISTWRILGDGPGEGQVIRFVLQPDPWAPFRVRVP